MAVTPTSLTNRVSTNERRLESAAQTILPRQQEKKALPAAAITPHSKFNHDLAIAAAQPTKRRWTIMLLRAIAATAA